MGLSGDVKSSGTARMPIQTTLPNHGMTCCRNAVVADLDVSMDCGDAGGEVDMSLSGDGVEGGKGKRKENERLCMRACVRVCVRKGEREMERESHQTTIIFERGKGLGRHWL